MGDGNAVGAQLFAEEHILIAIVAEALVERVGEHQVATDEEIGGVKVLIRMLLPLLCGMRMRFSHLITIAEITLECIGIAAYTDTAVDDIGTEPDAQVFKEQHCYFSELVDECERKQKLLLCSTNLDRDELVQRYRLRTMDRLTAITRRVWFEGESFRK